MVRHVDLIDYERYHPLRQSQTFLSSQSPPTLDEELPLKDRNNSHE